MLVKSGVCEKNEGDGNGDSILSGFGSSSGSSTDETLEQEEFLDELSRQMSEHMLQEEDGHKVANNNRHKTTLFEPNNVLEHKYGIDKEVKDQFQDGSRKAGFHGGAGAVPNGSGLRVLYLGESGSRNGSGAGTGVFIPHATNTQPDRQLSKKPGRCSKVLIPERVLHCLKQHHEKRNADQAHPATMFEARQNQMRKKHQETLNNTVVNNNSNDNDNDDDELQLPQEWTY